MLMRALTAEDSTSIISAEMLFSCDQLSWRPAGRCRNGGWTSEGPSSASGGMMALTREPSGRRASTIGDDSSTRRPTRETMRSMICSRWRSSRNEVFTLCKKAALFNEDVVLVVDQDVGDLGIAQQRLQRAEAEDFVEQIGLNLLLLVEVQRHALVGDDLLHDARHRLARLAGIDARQLLQIQLRDQGPVYFRFVVSPDSAVPRFTFHREIFRLCGAIILKRSPHPKLRAESREFVIYSRQISRSGWSPIHR